MTVKFNWLAPTTHKSGRPIAAGELTDYELDMQVEGAPGFTNLLKPVAADVSASVDGVDSTPGLYHFRLRAMAGSAGGDYALASLTIPDLSGLSAPTSFTVMFP